MKIVGIQFKEVGKVYYFDPLNNDFKLGEYAIVETVRGVELGKVIIPNREVEDEQIEYELKPVIRKATDEDVEQEKKNAELAKKWLNNGAEPTETAKSILQTAGVLEVKGNSATKTNNKKKKA